MRKTQRPVRRQEEICPHCGGTGRVGSNTASARGRKAGNASVLAGGKIVEGKRRKTMSERGRLGGAPRLITVGDLMAGGLVQPVRQDASGECRARGGDSRAAGQPPLASTL